MNFRASFINLILKEWLVIISALGLIITCAYTKQFPTYSIDDIQVLFLLFVLFVTVNGLKDSGVISKIAQRLEKGKFISLKLILITFFLSMIVTNDISLIVIVPLTLSLNINKKGILVILEAMAANAGSALTPIGNPQNLFIYWHYNISPAIFIKTIFPFSFIFLLLLVIVTFFIKTQKVVQISQISKINYKAYIYSIFLAIVLLAVLHIIPILITLIVILFALIFDRKSLNIDYPLLFSFLFFFGIADNLKIILASKVTHSGHIFMLSALSSQIISNVPAALLFANFTQKWQALLWGVNAGGFGSLFASLANLIAYRIYISHNETDDKLKFTINFLAIGYFAFSISVGLYFLLY